MKVEDVTHLTKRICSIVFASIIVFSLFPATTFAIKADDEMNMFENSDFIEKEQPELTEETKQFIALYQADPSMENYLNLRDVVIKNYDAVLARKEAKLTSLKEETAGKPGGDDKVAEMEDIVQEMYKTYWNRINTTMLRFTDSRLLKWKISDAANYDYIPVMGAGTNVYVKRTPVTNAEYFIYLADTGKTAPQNWIDGSYPAEEENYPVNFISYEDAVAYCSWLTEKDGTNTYRLPNESEWELAAGHMPKDADFNCGVNEGRTPVDQYADVTRGAHGAIDFWGNVWEWTSTIRSSNNDVDMLGVKGGAWNSLRTDCRTEYRKESRAENMGYEDVGFRVLKILNGEEPEQKVDLAMLKVPMVSANRLADDIIQLSWQPVKDAVEYQIFDCCEETGLVKMLDRTTHCSFTLTSPDDGSYSYIVQPISYTVICDNVSSEYSVKVEDIETPLETLKATAEYNDTDNSLKLYWEPCENVNTYYVYKYNLDTKQISKVKTISDKTECTYRNVENGKQYCFIISTKKLSNKQGYSGTLSTVITIPETNLLS